MAGQFREWVRGPERAYLIGFVILVIVAAVAYFPPLELSIESNDQLDSLIPYYQMLPSPWETLFRPGYVYERALDGLPIGMMGTADLMVIRLVYGIFPAYWDTSIYFTLMLLGLYVSAILPFVIAKRRFSDQSWLVQLDPAAVAFGAAAVALFPHSMPVTGAIVGFNLFLAGAMLSFLPGRVWSALGFYLLAAMFGGFVQGGLFYFPAVFVLFTIYGFVKGNWRPLWISALGLVLTVFIEYRLFWGLIFSDVESHRAVWLDGREFVFGQIFQGHYWANAFHEMRALIDGSTAHYHFQWNTEALLPWTALVSILAFIAAWAVRSLRARTLEPIAPQTTLILVWIAGTMIFMGLIIFGFGVVQSNMLDFEALFGVPVQLGRFIVALPFLSVLFLALVLHLAFARVWTLAKQIVLALLIVGMALWLHTPLDRRLENMAFRIQHGFQYPYYLQYTAGTYYSGGIYDELKAYLGPDWPQERVISVGGDPMVPVYNGFHALVGYYASHPLDYHREFRAVIAPALERDPVAAGNYDGWGNRIGVPVTAFNPDGSIELHIDGCALANMGGTLVISGYPVANPEDSQLRREAVLIGLNLNLSGWLYLYRPDCPAGADAAE